MVKTLFFPFLHLPPPSVCCSHRCVSGWTFGEVLQLQVSERWQKKTQEGACCLCVVALGLLKFELALGCGAVW